jgi:hypothetical protein
MIKLSQILNESDASEEAKKMGLDYLKFGRYGKDDKVTHVTDKNGKLVPIKPQTGPGPKAPPTGVSGERPVHPAHEPKRPKEVPQKPAQQPGTVSGTPSSSRAPNNIKTSNIPWGDERERNQSTQEYLDRPDLLASFGQGAAVVYDENDDEFQVSYNAPWGSLDHGFFPLGSYDQHGNFEISPQLLRKQGAPKYDKIINSIHASLGTMKKDMLHQMGEPNYQQNNGNFPPENSYDHGRDDVYDDQNRDNFPDRD